jgi:hypothetical protein
VRLVAAMGICGVWVTDQWVDFSADAWGQSRSRSSQADADSGAAVGDVFSGGTGGDRVTPQNQSIQIHGGEVVLEELIHEAVASHQRRTQMKQFT